ncbi:MAG: RNase P subunit p30 family protein [Methanotrichaceae archaeon]
MSFYEWDIMALPEGSDSPSRLGLAAKHLGYDGIIICNSEPGNIFRPDASEKIKGISISFGARVVANTPRSMTSRVDGLRSKYPFIAVYGSSKEINRAACENPNVDVLLHPGDGKHILEISSARAAKLNQVAIGIDLSPLIRLHGSSRSKWLNILRRSLDLIRKFDLDTMITAGCRSHLDLRAPRDLLALAEIAGFEPSEAERAMRLPAKILDLNMRSWEGPGVELL